MPPAVVLSCLLLGADPAAGDLTPPPIKLTLRPAAAPVPALKYRLLPSLADQTPGNAVDCYRRAAELLKEIEQTDRGKDLTAENERQMRWQEIPATDLPREEVRIYLRRYEAALREVQAGSRRERCDWETADRLHWFRNGPSPPELTGLREWTRLLVLRARLEVADGEVDAALRDIRDVFAIARHAAEAPSLSSTLIALSLASQAAHAVDCVLAMSTAPNLYWALTDLPCPLVDFRRGFEALRVEDRYVIPGLADSLADLQAGPLSPKQAREALHKICQTPPLKLPDQQQPPAVQALADRKALGRRILARHEHAKQVLIANGRTRERVEAMPHIQVALLYAYVQLDRERDELVKCLNLPFWQAAPMLGAAEKREEEAAAKDGPEQPAIPVARSLALPGVYLFRKRVHVDRKIAALRVVEALRVYAAAHGGSLPASLDEIKDVPIPPNPLTGKPFTYKLSGGTATLSAPPPPGEGGHLNNTFTYEITLKR